MTDFAAGVIDYNKYSEFVKAMNTNLKKRNAKISIVKFAKGSLLEKTSTLFPIDHIKFETKKAQEVYEKAEAMIDYDSVIGGNFYGC